MTHAKELFDAGKLDEAIEELLRDVKANPSEISKRTFLFELSCFTGDWARAERQLDVIGHQSTQAELGVMIYRANIKAEQERQRVFDEGVQPHFLKEPPAYVDLCIAAIKQIRQGELQQARATLDQAEEERPAIAGNLFGKKFIDFRDYDDLVAPVLEVFVKDKYVWLPFEQIKRLDVTPPRVLRDLLWSSAHIEATDGTIGEVYIPALYAGTSDSDNDQLRLGRMTDWKQIGDSLYRSYGLRVFAVDGEEKSLFEATRVEFDPVGEQAAEPVQ